MYSVQLADGSQDKAFLTAAHPASRSKSLVRKYVATFR